jgi:signal transduction histidine kinase
MSDPDPLVDEPARAHDAARELDCLVMMGTIAGRVAHEINNPLASIQNAFMLVKDAIPPSHPHYQYVGAIEREIQRIATVTRSLAETYRPEQDRAVGVAVSTIVADAARLASQTGGVRVLVNHHGHLTLAAPAGLMRHAVHQTLALVMQSADTAEPISIDVHVDADCLSVRIRYRPQAGRSAEPPRERFPHRLVAAMGGTIEFGRPEPGWQGVALQIPIVARTEGSE